MKTVVITGSARGFGYAMLEEFRKNDFNTVICDINEEELIKAKEKLNQINSKGKIISIKCNITKEEDINNLIEKSVQEFKTIDIWINNAGVNQDNINIWDCETNMISKLIDINLKGTIYCSKNIIPIMKKQGKGQIFNVEGFGSNGELRTGLSIYGTSKRACDYFEDSLAKEIEDNKLNILIGKITPGIMITNFIHKSLGDGKKIEIPEKTKKIYNILGDYPETIAKFIVPKIITNEKNNVNFVWLTKKGHSLDS